MNTSSKQNMYMIRCPAVDEMCCLRVRLPSTECPLPQWHIMQCRELIFTEKDIVASPVLDREKAFLVIMQQSLYKTGRIQLRLKKRMLLFDKPVRVSLADFQACLQYTIMARMSGQWNQVGEYLVHGEDFLVNSRRVEAIKLVLNVSHFKSIISLLPYGITMMPCTLLDFGISAKVVNNFLANIEAEPIEEHSITSKWCQVLPSMKKGQIINITHSLPPECPFKSYKEMKKYWRATYGYYLPESEESVYYCQVYFKLIGDILFTYPNCCVRAQEAVIFRCQNQDTENRFICELSSKLPAVCATPLTVEQPARSTTSNLASVAVLQNNSDVNLTKCEEKVLHKQATEEQPRHNPTPKFVEYHVVKSNTGAKEAPLKKSLILKDTRILEERQHLGDSRPVLGSLLDHQSAYEGRSNSPMHSSQVKTKINYVNQSAAYINHGSGVKERIVPIFTSKFRHQSVQSTTNTISVQQTAKPNGKPSDISTIKRKFQEERSNSVLNSDDKPSCKRFGEMKSNIHQTLSKAETSNLETIPVKQMQSCGNLLRNEQRKSKTSLPLHSSVAKKRKNDSCPSSNKEPSSLSVHSVIKTEKCQKKASSVKTATTAKGKQTNGHVIR